MLTCDLRIPDGKPPRFPKKPTIRQSGDLLIMECILEANPCPDIAWFQGTRSIADSKRVKMLRKSTGKDTYLLTLEIANPSREDGGNYRCNAFNNYGESNANISLNFQGMTLLDAGSPLLFQFLNIYYFFFTDSTYMNIYISEAHAYRIYICMCVYQTDMYMYISIFTFIFS